MCMSERGFCLLVSISFLSLKFLWTLFSLLHAIHILFLPSILPSWSSHVSSLSCLLSILLCFLYIPWPLTCHHSCPSSSDGAGGARVAALNTNVSSEQCEGKKTTQLLQSPESIYAAAVSKAPLSVALPPPQSTPTPALATRIISSGRKSFPLVSYYSFLHQLMMSQSIHKFVVVCRFEKFDMAAGCTGMKELSGQTPKM